MPEQMMGLDEGEMEDPYGAEGDDSQAMAEEEEEEFDPIQKKINAIIELCKKKDGMYGDTDFPPNDQSLYKNLMELPDYAEHCPVVEWMRPQENGIKDGDNAEDSCTMIKNGLRPGDVK